MISNKTCAAAAALTLALATLASAQTKEIPGSMKTLEGTVEAIDHAKHVLTLKDAKGSFTNIDLPGAARFDEVKVGSKVMVRYYDNVTARLKPAGEAPVDKETAGLAATTGEGPGGTLSTQRTMTVTISAIDLKTGAATYEGPNGFKYTRRIEDPKMLEKVKVGDRLDVTWTEAVQISVVN